MTGKPWKMGGVLLMASDASQRWMCGSSCLSMHAAQSQYILAAGLHKDRLRQVQTDLHS